MFRSCSQSEQTNAELYILAATELPSTSSTFKLCDCFFKKRVKVQLNQTALFLSATLMALDTEGGQRSNKLETLNLREKWNPALAPTF